jgi:membrane associated rhomboid family serine protease
MIIPYSTEVLIKKWPFSNLAIMGLCIVAFLLMLSGHYPPALFNAMILRGWNPIGLIGYQFLHGGFLHIALNMLYLWVFGNAVCEKVGNWVYATIFLMAGVVAGAVHNIMAGGASVGASGSINGILGLYLVLYPINRIYCFYWFFRVGTFAISGYWLILFWFVVDAWQAISGAETGIAYWAHVGGFLFGFGMGFVFLKLGIAKMAPRYDNPTLLDYMRKRTGHDSDLHELRTDPELQRSASGPTDRVSSSSLSTTIELACPHCSQHLEVPPDIVGTIFACSVCGGDIELVDD